VVQAICQILDELQPKAIGSYSEQISFVSDRAGHDRRYAIDARKLAQELAWQPIETFESGLRKTVQWYLTHNEWIQKVTSGEYRQWISQHYG
jgi:dTDP-glucose 4,6-dehydratase